MSMIRLSFISFDSLKIILTFFLKLYFLIFSSSSFVNFYVLKAILWCLGGRRDYHLHLQNSYVEILIPSIMILGGGTTGRWLDHEGGTLMNAINALVEEARVRFLVPSTVWGKREKLVVCNPKENLLVTQTCWHLALSASRTVRSKFFYKLSVCA